MRKGVLSDYHMPGTAVGHKACETDPVEFTGSAVQNKGNKGTGLGVS